MNHEAGILLVLFVLCYSLSLGPVPWILVGEILPAKGVSVAVIFDWCGFTILSLAFKPAAEAIGRHNMFFIFAGCNLFVCFWNICYRAEILINNRLSYSLRLC